MKIQCDVCNKAEAAVFCTADEAALCCGCDHRVHHANKLASKHLRFSLLHPSNPNQFPLCDICQEKRGLLFCQQDRAILCRDCDSPIHSANELTMKHTRFLLTGLKLQELPSSSSSSSDSDLKPTAEIDSISDDQSTQQVCNNITTTTPFSISEYLIETLPGWHVEDLLETNNNNNNNSLFGFSKTDESTFVDCEIEDNYNSNCRNMSNNNMGIWVPQAPSNLPLVHPTCSGMSNTFLVSNYDTYSANSKLSNNIGSATRWSDDNSFTVPQINLPSPGSKRSRPFW